MLKGRKNKGFTLVEIMVVVTLIGFLAMLAMPGFQRIKLRALTASFTADARLFSKAFQRYAQENGTFPASAGVGVIPDGMDDYLNQQDWGKTSSIGGSYGWTSMQSPGVSIGIITVNGATLSAQELELIDTWIDDGNLGTGNVITVGAGTIVYYIVELST